MYGGEIAVCAITAAKDGGAAEHSFGSDKYIVAVDEDRAACDIFGRNLDLAAVLQLAVGTGRAHDSQSLAVGKGKMIANQLQGAFGGVTFGQQETIVRNRPSKVREHLRAKSSLILWVCPAMSSFVRHGKYYSRLADEFVQKK